MKKSQKIILVSILTCLLVWGLWIMWKNVRGAAPALRAPSADIAEIIDQQAPPVEASNDVQEEATAEIVVEQPDFPLTLPEGFRIGVFARDLGAPRVLTFDSQGTLLTSITKRGRVVALPDADGDGRADRVVPILEDLDRPHGLLVRCEDPSACLLYVAETDQVARYAYDPETFSATQKETIIELPGGGRHFTRTLHTVRDGTQERLLISIGSTCDTCVEKDPRAAKVLVADFDGSELKDFATGLRNSVFLTTHPVTDVTWATEMGRDHLGDNLPPDEVNILEEGRDYGWPWCYGQQVHDRTFDRNQNPCQDTVPAAIDLPAHVAPLGLTFVPENAWGGQYAHDLLVAYHGSWNSSVPVGYTIARFAMNANGTPEGGSFVEEDFIAGWLQGSTALGRPAGLEFGPDGALYISDDHAGVIYRVDNF